MVDFDGFRDLAEQVEDLAEQFDDAADEVDDAIERALLKTALAIESDAKRLAPVDTGNLRKSIEARQVSPSKYVIGTPLEYAPYVEYGTGPHLITSNGEDPLTFKVDGQWISKHQIDHPGTPAQPYLRPALNANRDALPDNIAAEIEDTLED